MLPKTRTAVASRLDPTRKLAKVHILVIDSSPQITGLFKNMLQEFGFSKIYTANNGFQGVHILREVRINLIITDWELNISSETKETASNVITHKDILPISGVDFVRRLRQSAHSPNPFIPVIMFADAVEKIQILKARDAGANEIVMKPLSAEELCKRIMHIIDHPRIFVTADAYKGPCRRRSKTPQPVPVERRRKDIRVIKHNGNL